MRCGGSAYTLMDWIRLRALCCCALGVAVMVNVGASGPRPRALIIRWRKTLASDHRNPTRQRGKRRSSSLTRRVAMRNILIKAAPQ